MGFREEFWQVLSEINIANDFSKDKTMQWISKLENHLKNHLPDRVFKYRACDTRSIDALSRNVLYAPPASYMNDPYDSLVYVDRDYIIESIKYGFSRKYIEDIRIHKMLPKSVVKLLPKEIVQQIIDQCLNLTEEDIDKIEHNNLQSVQQVIENVNTFIDKAIKDLQNRAYISSFASTHCDPSMWNRYADNNKGFVLEYDVNNTRFDICRICKDYGTSKCDGSITQAYWYPIIYREQRFDATEWIDYKVGQMAFASLGISCKSEYVPDILIYDKCCLLKGKAWEKEEEWRLVCYPKYPMLEIKPIVIHTPVPCAIYYGTQIAEENFRLLHKIIDEFRANGAVIKEYQMYLDPYSKDFNLKFKEI